jgi:hypothetical protein
MATGARCNETASVQGRGAGALFLSLRTDVMCVNRIIGTENRKAVCVQKNEQVNARQPSAASAALDLQYLSRRG